MRKVGLVLGGIVVLAVIAFGIWLWSRPERGTTGQVSTRFRWLGPNDRIVVDGFDDPKVRGVACHISRAVTGGVKGELGFAEDTSDASIACRQVGDEHRTVGSFPRQEQQRLEPVLGPTGQHGH